MKAVQRSLITAGVVCWVNAAVAEEDAGAMFARATALVEKHECKAAMSLLRDVFARTKSPNALLYVARCQRELGQPMAAYSTYGDLLEFAKTSKYAETRSAAVEERSELRAMLGTLMISAPSLPGLVVTVGDDKLSPQQYSDWVVAPGNLHLHAEAPGYRDFDEDITVSPGVRRKVTLTLSSAAESSPGSPTRPMSLRLPGYLALGVAGAAYLVSGIAYASASSAYNDLRDECVVGCTQARIDEQSSTGRTLDSVTNVTLVVGTVALVTGTTLVLIDLLRKKETKSADLVFRGLTF